MTAEDLRYPNMKADLKECEEFLHELCQIVWDGAYKPSKTMFSIPPRPQNFDMQLSAAFEELRGYRNTGKTPEQVAEWAKAEREGRLREVQRWIPLTAENDYPPVGLPVNILLKSNNVGTGVFMGQGWQVNVREYAQYDTVTHWMPLPQTPTGKDD